MRRLHFALVVIAWVAMSVAPALAAFDECGPDCVSQFERDNCDDDGGERAPDADGDDCDDASPSTDEEQGHDDDCGGCPCGCCITIAAKAHDRISTPTIVKSARLEEARSPSQREGLSTRVRVFRPPRLAA